MTATADLPNKNIKNFTEKFSFAAWDKSIIIDSEDWDKIKLIAKTLMKWDTWAKAVSVAFVGDDMVFTLDDLSTVTLTDAKTDLKWDQWIQWNPWADGTDWATITSAAFVWNNLVFTLDDDSTVTIVNAKLDLKWDTGDTWEDWTDWEDWVWITSITKTWTVWLVDTYTILYTDSTTSTFDITNWKDWTNWTNGVDWIDGTDWISFTPKWAYDAWTAYVANDVVSYLWSSWTALQNTTGNTPVEWAYWTLLAAKWTDWDWAWDVMWPATNTDSYIPQRDWADSKTLKSGIDPATLLTTTAWLKLDQTTPQTITWWQPIQNTLTASELVATDWDKKLSSLAVATYPSLAELAYVKGVTSWIQSQLNWKQATLVSWANIKTINNTSILWSGDITITGGGAYNPVLAQVFM